MYLNFFQHKGKIYLKYIDDGKIFYHVEKDYTPEIFVYQNNKTDKISGYTIFGDPLVRMNKNENIFETRNLVKKYNTENFPVFGYSKVENAFVYDMFKDKKPKMSDVNICYIDIETECENGFPDVQKANEKINIISLSFSNTNIIHSIYVNEVSMEDTSEVKYYQCKSEIELLTRFLEIFSNNGKYSDILSGWHVKGFDIPYLYNRIGKILGADSVNKLSPFGLVSTREENDDYGNVNLIINIHGISIVDYLPLYKKYAKTPRETYKLDFIAKVELKDSKVKHVSKIPGHLLYKKYFKDFIDYNVHDVRLIINLEKKLKMLYLAIVLAYTAFVNFDEIFSNMRVLDNLIYIFLKKKNVYFEWSKHLNHRESFEGGAVKETIPGKYKWVVSFDVTAEYPSLIRALNISPETYLGSENDIQMNVDKILSGDTSHLEKIIKKNITCAANGTTYSKTKSGFMADVVRMLFDKRKEYKKKKVDADKEHNKELSEEFDIYQNAYKVMLNSLYGIMGNPYFRFYGLQYAEAITLSGQALVKWVMNDLNKAIQKLMNDDIDRCIASDTDSVYFCFDDLVKKKFGNNYKDEDALNFIRNFSDIQCDALIEKSIDRFSKHINAFEPEALSMKREVVSDVSIFIAKKRYIMSVLDKEGAVYDRGDEIKITGVEAVKSSTPEICRDKMEELFKILLFEGADEYHKFISDFYKEFKNLEMDDIAENKSVSNINKYLDYDNNMIKGTPINSRAAITYNKLVDTLKIQQVASKIRDNDKIKYCYMKMPNPLKQNVFGWLNNLPDEMKYLTSFADYDIQFEKTFKNAVEPIARLAGIRDENLADKLDFI